MTDEEVKSRGVNNLLQRRARSLFQHEASQAEFENDQELEQDFAEDSPLSPTRSAPSRNNFTNFLVRNLSSPSSKRKKQKKNCTKLVT